MEPTKSKAELEEERLMRAIERKGRIGTQPKKWSAPTAQPAQPAKPSEPASTTTSSPGQKLTWTQRQKLLEEQRGPQKPPEVVKGTVVAYEPKTGSAYSTFGSPSDQRKTEAREAAPTDTVKSPENKQSLKDVMKNLDNLMKDEQMPNAENKLEEQKRQEQKQREQEIKQKQEREAKEKMERERKEAEMKQELERKEQERKEKERKEKEEKERREREMREKKERETKEKAESNSAGTTSGEKVCSVCKKAVEDNFLSLGDECFHKDCMVCSRCHKVMTECYRDTDGSLFCTKCSLNGAEGCAKCGKPIEAEFVNALGVKWHNDCFVCTQCGNQLPDSFDEYGNKPFCSEDCVALFRGHTCAVCKKPCVGRYLGIGDSFFHKTNDCFRCALCNGTFPDFIFFEIDDKAYCHVCAQKMDD